jgi:PAS domain S-box-containing protein
MEETMFKTLNSKISLIYIGLVALIAVLGTVSVVSLVYLERSLNGLMTDNYRSISDAQNMTDALENQDNAVIDYISFGSGTALDSFYSNDKKFMDYYDAAAHNVTEHGEQGVINSIGADYNAFEKTFSKLQRISDTQDSTAAENYYRTALLPETASIQAQLASLIQINQKAMFNSRDRASHNTKSWVYALLAISFAAVSGGFFVSRYFVNRFLSPLGMLTQGLSRVKAGELELTLDIKSSDEIGRLAHEFNEMLKRLSAYEQSTMGSLLSERNKVVAIVKSISDPIVVLDQSYRIILINNACEKHFGISEENILGRHFLEAIHNGALFDLMTQSVENTTTHTESVIQLPKNGKDYYFNAVITPIKGLRKDTAGYILLMQNVTKLKELDQLRTDFFAAVSHELKTPLTSIIMGASLLSEDGFGELNADQKDVIRTISEDGEKLSNFVAELLEISKIESKGDAYSFAPCAVYAIVESSCHQFAEMSLRAGVSLKNTVPPDLPLVNVDFEKVLWVTNNLLSNALKYTRPNDSITVKASIAEKFVEIYVADTGIGIPVEFHEQIFDKFVQIPNPEIEIRGSGIGLSVAKEVITAHGGTISVESTPGQGSTFRFTLPLYDETK